MSWSWRVGRIAGIGIDVHWSFLLLLGWIAMIYAKAGGTIAAFQGVAFITAVFACIVLHELGHALTARRFGIQTRDITLLPIGGVARLERMPEDPRQEILVALGGPAVTLAIAAALFGLVLLGWGPRTLLDLDMTQGNFLARLMWVNAILLGFNLLPAFPMDGGRVLRAVLHFELDYVQATEIASRVGQAMAILFAALGLLFNPWLLLIALFVFFGAQQETNAVRVRAACEGVPVRDAMVTQFQALAPGTPIGSVIDLLITGEQRDFPVVENDAVIGMLTRSQLVTAIRDMTPDTPTSEVMERDCALIEDDEMLDRAFARMRERDCSTLPVVHGGRLVGIVTLENVGEWMMVQPGRDRAR